MDDSLYPPSFIVPLALHDNCGFGTSRGSDKDNLGSRVENV